MSFTAAIRSVLAQYATFSGRAMRSEYWWFYLFTFLVGIAATGIDGVLNTAVNNEIGVVGLLLNLALLLPSLAVTARRLHDTGRSGWWMLLPVVPAFVALVAAVGWAFVAFGTGSPSDHAGLLAVAGIFGLLTLAAGITLLVFLCQDSKPGPNRYGPSPKEPTGPAGYYPQYGYVPPHGPGYPQQGGQYAVPQQPGQYPQPPQQP